MNATQRLMEKAVSKLGTTSTREIAKVVGVSHTMVHFWIVGRSPITDPVTIAQVCLAIGEKPELWFAELAAEKSADPLLKAWAKHVASLGVVLLFGVIATPQASAKSAENTLNQGVSEPTLYIMSILKNLLAASYGRFRTWLITALRMESETSALLPT